jgi:hypothetical protein
MDSKTNTRTKGLKKKVEANLKAYIQKKKENDERKRT